MTKTFAAVLLAEVRTTRRLARTWVMAALAVGTTLIGYLFFANLHGESSSFLPSAVTSPRFLVDSFGGYLLWFLMAATVFLGFDIGSRERRERIADAVDTRPVSNLQLLTGRLAGVVLTLAVPMAVTFALIQGVGTLGQLLDWDIQASIEPVSLAVFLVLDALPALAFWGAMVFLLAAMLRNRLAVAMVAFGLLGLAIWGFSRTPAWLVEYVAPAPDRLVSDLVTSVPDAATVAERLSVVAAAAGLLALAALLLPRPDTYSRIRCGMAAMVLVCVGAAGIASVVVHAHAELGVRDDWREARESATGASADIRTLAGTVLIDPGDSLQIDVTVTVAVPDPVPDRLVFPFNPGMATRAVRVDGQTAAFEHRDGLLGVELPATVQGELVVGVRADGIPNPDFAYLDSAIDYRAIAGANPLRNLGTEASLFDGSYVALMPGVHWLPDTLVRRRSARDFRHVDLVVQVPTGWLVAGPGRREALDAARYRFAPTSPVTPIGILAAEYERFATMIDGVELELLLSPRHTAPASYFEDTEAEIDDALTALFKDVATLGVRYPHGALRMVEVPARLRGYGGGWQMETTLALPGVLLLRERGFPTGRFYTPTVPIGGPFSTEKLERLRMLFREDRSGADPFAGLAHNLFLHQTEARGDGAAALNYLCHALVTRLLGDDEGYFSAHVYASSPSVRTLLVGSFASAFAGGSGSVSGEVFGAVRPPSVWERALGTPLADLQALEPSQAINILTMKGDAAARTIVDGAGREATARLVSELLRRYRGASFTFADFEEVAEEAGVDLPGLLGDWLHDASLPGFIAYAVTTVRLEDATDGKPRYQLRIDVFNGEHTPGLFRLRYRFGDSAVVHESDPVRVPGRAAMEAGLVTGAPIRELWVAPYLSLNRHEFPVRVPETDATAAADAVPFVGARSSNWRPVSGPGIVVDDLDPGFAATAPPGMDSSTTLSRVDIDEGLPVYQRADPVLEAHWSRQEQPTSWGRYRHTIARVTPGDGDRAATFSALLPESGRWRVDYFLPDLDVGYTTRSQSPFRLTANLEFTSPGNRGPRLGNYDMRISSAGSVHPVEFDAAAAEPGWTTLGRFDLDAGEVSLVVTNRTDGRTVVADAVRWVRDTAPD